MSGGPECYSKPHKQKAETGYSQGQCGDDNRLDKPAGTSMSEFDSPYTRKRSILAIGDAPHAWMPSSVNEEMFAVLRAVAYSSRLTYHRSRRENIGRTPRHSRYLLHDEQCIVCSNRVVRIETLNLCWCDAMSYTPTR